MDVVEPRWASWSFLLYAGAATLLGALIAFLSWLEPGHGDAALVGGSAAAVLVAGGAGLVLRAGHPISAGLLAVIAAWAVVALCGGAIAWAGWSPSRSGSLFGGFGWQLLLVELVEVVTVLVALRLFRFPLLVWQGAGAAWLLVVGLLTGGGDWSAIVGVVVGLVFLTLARRLDRGARRGYALWLHVWAGATIGGGIVYLVGGHARWWVLVVLAVGYVGLAERFARSSWAVLGAVGLLAAAAHWSVSATDAHLSLFGPSSATRPWAPSLVFGATGVVLTGLGGLLATRARHRRVAAEAAQG